MYSDHSVSKGEKWAQDEYQEGSMAEGGGWGMGIGNQRDVDNQERRKYVTGEEIKKREVKQQKRKYEKDE